MEQQDQADLLQNIEDENYVDPVHWTVRFVNYFVDWIVMGVIFNVIEKGLAMIAKTPKLSESFAFQGDVNALVYGLILSFGVTFTYYLVFETATNGRTAGKMFTGTIAITQDGSQFTFKHALLRTLCRFIPFEPISTFGYLPWHDRFTKTVVVKKTW